MPLFNWPYTNLHNLNLDWIIKKIKNVETAESNTASSEEAAAGSAASAAASQEAAALSEANAAASATAAGNYYNQISENVSTLVTGWMDEHITPTTPPVDDTLTIQGAAADAKKTGYEITDLKNALDLSVMNGDNIANTKTILNNNNTAVVNNGDGTYTIGTSDFGVTIFGNKMNLQKGIYKLFGVPSGFCFLSTDISYTGQFVSNNTTTPKTFIIENDTECYLGYRIGTRPSEAFTITPYLIAPLPYSNKVNKLETGYYDINEYITPFSYINSNVSIGSVVDITKIYDSSFCCAVIPAVAGDAFKVTGNGGNAPRLYAVTNTDFILISKASANEGTDGLVITFNADGYLIFNASSASVATYTPNISKRFTDANKVFEASTESARYDYRNKGLNVLSAFSNVTCVGDSLTASVVYTGESGGTYTTRSAYKKYPQILGDKIGAEWESIATGGFSASDWWNAYKDDLVSKTNNLVIVYLGTNGGLTDTVDSDAVGDDYNSYANTNTGNYCKIVRKAQTLGARILLLHIYLGGGGNVSLTNNVIDKIGERFNVPVVTVPYLEDNAYHSYPDGTGYNTTHYNDLGYSAFTESLIRNVGALPSDTLVNLIPF